MSFMDNVDRLEVSLFRVKELSSKSAAPAGPFTLSFSSPFSETIREAEPGEREIFRYVGPKSTPSQTHAPPSASSQPLFELNPPKPSTPLRPSTTSRGVVTDPDILLGAALKLVDGYRPMPRKRKLIVSLYEKYETLKESIVSLEEAVESFDPSQHTASAPIDDGWGDDIPHLPPPSAGPSVQERTRKVEAEVKDLEKRIAAARKAKIAREKAAAEAAPPVQATPPLPSPLRISTPPVSPPRAPINPLIQTPTITRFLNSSRSRTPSRDYDQPAREENEEAVVEQQHEGEEEEEEEDGDETQLGRDDEEDATIVLGPALLPPPAPEAEPEPAPPAPVVVIEKEVKVEVEITKEVVKILNDLWDTFPDILRQAPGAPLEGTVPATDTLALLASLSSLPPPPPPSSSSLSLASSSAPHHPPTTQGVLLAHLFLLLLHQEKEAKFTATMGEVKRGVVERVERARKERQEQAGQGGGGGQVDEGMVTKQVYWGVGKRGLVIVRGVGEARVGFV